MLFRASVVCDLTSNSLAGIALSLVVAASIPQAAAFAATLILTDGTVIQGDIKTLQGDVYTVETESLGTLRVRKQNVRTIDHGEQVTVRAPTSGSSPANAAELQAIQLRMLQTPDLLSMIQSLQSDPEVQAVLADPEIVSALTSGNLAALLNNPKIIALTGNSNVRGVIEEAKPR